MDEAETAPAAIPTIAYEAVEEDLRANGVAEPRDLLGADGHHEHWRTAHGVPRGDEDAAASQQVFARYLQAPDGDEASPPKADLWQYLLKVGEAVEWTETPTSRSKDVPVCLAMLAEPADLTDEQVAQGRRRLETQGPIPDGAWTQFERHVRKGPAAARACRAAIAGVLERRGVEIPGIGRCLIVTLSVSR